MTLTLINNERENVRISSIIVRKPDENVRLRYIISVFASTSHKDKVNTVWLAIINFDLYTHTQIITDYYKKKKKRGGGSNYLQIYSLSLRVYFTQGSSKHWLAIINFDLYTHKSSQTIKKK